jgi:hypothetical protein
MGIEASVFGKLRFFTRVGPRLEFHLGPGIDNNVVVEYKFGLVGFKPKYAENQG